jgi:glycosyltransferase involved in cell wall biosynthesis
VKHADTAAPRARRIEHIPNGVAARAQRKSLPPAPRYLVSGRIAPSKQLETIIAAFCGVRQRFPGAELHVLGVAEPRHAAYAASLERAPGVFFRGAGFDLAHLDEPWTAAVVLGIHQGCPNAVLEAMAAAIPVIANASGGTSEVLGGGEAGWLLSEEAGSGELARAMLEVHADPDRASARGLAAMRRARDRHSIDAMAERYLRVLEDAEPMPAHEKMGSWNSATARAAPHPLPTAALPVMPGS